MTTKRTPISRLPRTHITPQAVDIFRRYQTADADERTRLAWDLHSALGLPPWHCCVTDAANAEPPSWSKGEASTMGARTWEAARELWLELTAAAKAARAQSPVAAAWSRG
jgi:hypothetical protein